MAIIIIMQETFISERPVKNIYNIDLFEADLQFCEQLWVYYYLRVLWENVDFNLFHVTSALTTIEDYTTVSMRAYTL